LNVLEWLQWHIGIGYFLEYSIFTIVSVVLPIVLEDGQLPHTFLMAEHEASQGALMTGILIAFKKIFIVIKLIMTLQHYWRTFPKISSLIEIKLIILIVDDFWQVLNLLNKILLLISELLEFMLQPENLLG